MSEEMIDSAGKPHDEANRVSPVPCKCGWEWSQSAYPNPHDVCCHTSGAHDTREYLVVCPRCKADGPLKATPWWAITAWNELLSAYNPNERLREALVALADLAEAARNACDARRHTELIDALAEADRLSALSPLPQGEDT